MLSEPVTREHSKNYQAINKKDLFAEQQFTQYYTENIEKSSIVQIPSFDSS